MMKNSKINKPIDILLVEDNPGDVRLAKEALKDSKLLNNIYLHCRRWRRSYGFFEETRKIRRQTKSRSHPARSEPAQKRRQGSAGGH